MQQLKEIHILSLHSLTLDHLSMGALIYASYGSVATQKQEISVTPTNFTPIQS